MSNYHQAVRNIYYLNHPKRKILFTQRFPTSEAVKHVKNTPKKFDYSEIERIVKR